MTGWMVAGFGTWTGDQVELVERSRWDRHRWPELHRIMELLEPEEGWRNSAAHLALLDRYAEESSLIGDAEEQRRGEELPSPMRSPWTARRRADARRTLIAAAETGAELRRLLDWGWVMGRTEIGAAASWELICSGVPREWIAAAAEEHR